MNKLKNIGLLITVIGIVLITSNCFSQNLSSETESTSEINFSLPKRTGKYAVGRQLTYLTDENRTNSPINNDKREIALWIYYPAGVSKQSAEELILPTAWAEQYRGLMEKRLGKSAANALLSLKTDAQTNALIASNKNSFPVLIFAPGSSWLPTDYSSIIENLAADGYIVVAFAAASLSPVILFPNGSITNSARVDNSTYGLIGADFSFICNQLEKLNQDPSLKIEKRMDTSKIGVFGHSLGGAAAILGAANNDKINAAANLDGDFSGDAENASPKQAILYITTQPPSLTDETPIENWDEERNEIRRKGIWEKLNTQSTNAFRVRIAKMFHTNFQDAAILPANSMPENLRNNRYGSIDGERGVKLTINLLSAFFNAQLKSEPINNLLEIEKTYPEIRIEKR